MKRWLVRLLSCLLVALCAFAGVSCAQNGDGEEIKRPDLPVGGSDDFVAENGLTYTKNENGESYFLSDIGACTEASPKIATTVNGLPVTGIGDYAFFGGDFTQITVPEGIREIGVHAFSNCKALTSVTLADSVTKIGEKAFYQCQSLRDVALGEGLGALEPYTLAMCPSLQTLRIPDSVTSVAAYAFEGSACLEKDGGIYYVDRWAVDCDAKLSQAALRAGTVGIADMAFFANVDLQQLSLVPTVRYIGKSAFDGCDRILKTEGGVSYVSGWAVDCDPTVTQVTLRADTVGISDQAFADCKSITNLAIRGNVSIGERAFYDFDNLEILTIGEGVTSIAELAFASCDRLVSVHIPHSVTSIAKAAFAGCTALQSLTVDDTNPVYRDSNHCLIETATKTLIAGCKSSVIPTDGSVTGIGDCAFYVCLNLASINVPDSVTWIGADAFYACVNLESVTLGSGVRRIDARAFLRCDSLATVYYGGGELAWDQIEISEQDNGNAPLLNATRQDITDGQP